MIPAGTTSLPVQVPGTPDSALSTQHSPALKELCIGVELVYVVRGSSATLGSHNCILLYE